MHVFQGTYATMHEFHMYTLRVSAHPEIYYQQGCTLTGIGGIRFWMSLTLRREVRSTEHLDHNL